MVDFKKLLEKRREAKKLKEELPMTNALVPLNDPKVQMVLAKVDTTGLSDVEKQELAMVLLESYQDSTAGFVFKPQKYSINKDACKFNDPLGNALDEIRAVVLVKQRTRGFWNEKDQAEEDTKPICQSLDGVTGNMRTRLGEKEWSDEFNEVRDCATCPMNQWGSATDDSGEERRGKACKEMRRMFIIPSGQNTPVMLSLPPTSINPFDKFFSARITQGIPDIAAEVIFSLVPAKYGRYSVAVINLKSGEKLTPMQMIEMNKVKKQFEESWKRVEIENDDYGAGAGAEQGTITVESDGEPY